MENIIITTIGVVCIVIATINFIQNSKAYRAQVNSRRAKETLINNETSEKKSEHKTSDLDMLYTLREHHWEIRAYKNYPGLGSIEWTNGKFYKDNHKDTACQLRKEGEDNNEQH